MAVKKGLEDLGEGVQLSGKAFDQCGPGPWLNTPPHPIKDVSHPRQPVLYSSVPGNSLQYLGNILVPGPTA